MVTTAVPQSSEAFAPDAWHPPVDVVFFDLRDTLGEVDRPGHLVPYRPSTEKLLTAMRQVVGVRVGVITNLPADVTPEQGRRMIAEAVLSQQDGNPVRLGDFIDPQGIVINHEVGVSKPDPRIYARAAEQMGVQPERCLFAGENLIEVLGAAAAGMKAQLKPCPPGREFLPSVITRMGETAKDSGRAFEAFLEHEHLLGERIFECGARIVDGLKGMTSPEIPANIRTAMAMLVYLTENFADRVHLQAEEAIIPLAVARGMDPRRGQWVFDQHEQARAYWKAMSTAWRRIQGGDPDDTAFAIGDFWRCTEAFVLLFRHHAERENDELYPEMGRHLNDTDDTLIMGLLQGVGFPDMTPYVAIVEAME
jgi:hemerythrin-like domain-containing protein